MMLKEMAQEKYILEGLNCSHCALKIEDSVKELPEVGDVKLNFAEGTITISGEREVMARMEETLQEISNKFEPSVKVRKKGKREKEEKKNYGWKYWPLFGGGLLFALALLAGQFSGLASWVVFALYLLSYLLIGGQVIKAALLNIKRGYFLDENFLMVLATVGAFIIKEYPEAVAVMLFYMIGELIQDKAVDHSRRSIRSLLAIRPDYANLQLGKEIRKVQPEEVKVGDRIIVKPGERVPLDGVILAGEGLMDTSALTGESVPRRVLAGDEVLSGMVNQDGLLEVEVKREYAQSTVARILELVEKASSKKAPTEKFITKFARYYTPLVVFTALGIAFLPPLFYPGAIFADWLYRALIFLVVSCPCALVISIPLGFFGGIGRASKEGILVKGGNYLEALNQVQRIVFDKTGTLTKGDFTVREVRGMNGFSSKEVLELAALAEVHSQHPIARSIKEAYPGNPSPGLVKSYREIAGQGIEAQIEDKKVLLGRKKLLEQKGIKIRKLKEKGTVVYLGINGKYAGYILIDDELKKDTPAALERLKEEGIKELIMLTGDRKEAAAQLAEELRLDQYYAELLPGDKVAQLETLLLAKNSPEEKLLFVGDGLNDAPVLARADIGVAMGGLGSDAAIEAADIVLMTDEPSKLVTALQIASQTRKIVWQNIILALGIKGLVLFLGALGWATMWEAVFADVGVALLAVLNSLRITRG